MKTLAVIKNELFQDYLRFVSTSDLPSVLDNPDIPVPFTCVESVDNSNADALLEQMKSYFNNSKIKNKDFFIFDENTTAQLQFMFNLIKLSSGQAATPVQVSAPVVKSVENVNAVEVAPVVPVKVAPEVVAVTPEPVVEAITPVVAPVVVIQPVVQEAPVVQVVPVKLAPAEVVEDVFSGEEDDPFGFKSSEEVKVEAPVVQTEPVVEVAPVVVEPVVVAKVEVVTPTVEVIASLGIPKGSTIHFIKDESITATLVDEKTVSYDNQNMTLVEAAKAAFKKSGTVGMAVGLSNWNFSGETLKAWKEKQLN